MREVEAESPTLIEGLPGTGMVASIAVDRITEQLGLEHYGNLHSDAFPPVATFEDGLFTDLVRVYVGKDPEVMTLQSGAPIPSQAAGPLADCVLQDLAHEFGRAIFIVGAPAQSEEQLRRVQGVATDEVLRGELEKAGIAVAEGAGLIGGPTGALLRSCHASNVPAVALVVNCHPKLPDPGAARAVIEEALEPLVEFDITTEQLEEQAEEIQKRKQQLAQQLEEGSGSDPAGKSSSPSMFR